MNRTLAASIGAPFMFNLLQINLKCLVELSDGTGQDHCAPRRGFLHDYEAVRGGEFPNGCDICRIGSELLCKILSPDRRRTPGGIKLPDVVLQYIASAA